MEMRARINNTKSDGFPISCRFLLARYLPTLPTLSTIPLLRFFPHDSTLVLLKREPASTKKKKDFRQPHLPFQTTAFSKNNSDLLLGMLCRARKKTYTHIYTGLSILLRDH